MNTEDKAMQEINERVVKVEEQVKTAFHRIEEVQKLTETVHRLATSIELLAQSQKTTERKVDTLASDMDAMKLRPGKAWDNAVKTILTAVVSAVAAYCLAKFGF